MYILEATVSIVTSEVTQYYSVNALLPAAEARRIWVDFPWVYPRHAWPPVPGLLKARYIGSGGSWGLWAAGFYLNNKCMAWWQKWSEIRNTEDNHRDTGVLAVVTSPATPVLQKQDLGSLIFKAVDDWMNWKTKFEHFRWGPTPKEQNRRRAMCLIRLQAKL